MEDHRSRRIEYYSHCSTRSANLPIFPRIVQIIVQLSQVSPTSSPFFEINTRRINFPRVSSSVNTFCKRYPVLVLSLIFYWSFCLLHAIRQSFDFLANRPDPNYRRKFHQTFLLSSKLTRVVLIFHAFPLPSAPSANLSCTCPITDLLLSLKTSNMSRTVEIFVFSTRSANLSIFPRIVSIQIIVQLSQVSPTSFPFFEINTRYINFPCISSSVNTFCKYYPVLVLSLISCWSFCLLHAIRQSSDFPANRPDPNYRKFHQPLLFSSKLTRVVLIFHAFPLPSTSSANCTTTDLLLLLKTTRREQLKFLSSPHRA